MLDDDAQSKPTALGFQALLLPLIGRVLARRGFIFHQDVSQYAELFELL